MLQSKIFYEAIRPLDKSVKWYYNNTNLTEGVPSVSEQEVPLVSERK